MMMMMMMMIQRPSFEIWEWISNFIQHFTAHMINYIM